MMSRPAARSSRVRWAEDAEAEIFARLTRLERKVTLAFGRAAPRKAQAPRGEANTGPWAAGQPKAGPAKRDAAQPHTVSVGAVHVIQRPPIGPG